MSTSEPSKKRKYNEEELIKIDNNNSSQKKQRSTWFDISSAIENKQTEKAVELLKDLKESSTNEAFITDVRRAIRKAIAIESSPIIISLINDPATTTAAELEVELDRGRLLVNEEVTEDFIFDILTNDIKNINSGEMKNNLKFEFRFGRFLELATRRRFTKIVKLLLSIMKPSSSSYLSKRISFIQSYNDKEKNLCKIFMEDSDIKEMIMDDKELQILPLNLCFSSSSESMDNISNCSEDSFSFCRLALQLISDAPDNVSSVIPSVYLWLRNLPMFEDSAVGSSPSGSHSIITQNVISLFILKRKFFTAIAQIINAFMVPDPDRSLNASYFLVRNLDTVRKLLNGKKNDVSAVLSVALPKDLVMLIQSYDSADFFYNDPSDRRNELDSILLTPDTVYSM